MIILHDEEEPDDDIPNIIAFAEAIQTQTIKDVKISEDLTKDQRHAAIQLLHEYKDFFSDIPGRTTVIEQKIVLTTNTSIRVKPYPIPLHFGNQVNKKIQDLLRLGIIKELVSE